MRISARLTLAALAATLLLAVGLSTASARNLSVSNQSIRLTWRSLEFTGAEIVIRCPVTLEGTFHARTIAKVENTLIGYITRAVAKQEACTNGIGAPFNGTERYNGGTPASSLPWHMTYKFFSGTLPNIVGIRILLLGFRFGIRDSAGLCTGQYGPRPEGIDAEASVGAGGVITELSPVPPNESTLIRRDGGIFCPATGRLTGRAEVMLLGTTTRITVTLI